MSVQTAAEGEKFCFGDTSRKLTPSLAIPTLLAGRSTRQEEAVALHQAVAAVTRHLLLSVSSKVSS